MEGGMHEDISDEPAAGLSREPGEPITELKKVIWDADMMNALHSMFSVQFEEFKDRKENSPAKQRQRLPIKGICRHHPYQCGLQCGGRLHQN